MEQPHRTQIVRFNLLAVLIGVACSLAVEQFVKEWSVPRLIATIAFLITSINFFHGKIVALEDVRYMEALTHRPRFALCDFVLNVSIILAFVFMALYLNAPRDLLLANITVRTLDIFLVAMVMHISKEHIVHTAQRCWLTIDCFALLCFAVTLAVMPSLKPPNLFVASMFLIVVLSDIAIDYSVNAPMYFSSADHWSDLAELWDEAQGEFGDIYRRKIIVPAIVSEVSLRGKRILELGCGNGCLARSLAHHGASEIVAVDKFSTMLAMANKYDSPTITYKQLDIELSHGTVQNGHFDLIVACFSLQDCASRSLAMPFKLMRENLAPHGRILVIYENDAAFEEYSHTTTSRRPLDPRRLSGKGRRWILSWGPKLLHFAQCDKWSTEIESFAALLQPKQVYTTITRHWSTVSYLKAGNLKVAGSVAPGLELAAPVSDLRVSGDVKFSILRSYELRPRFSMIHLRRQDQASIAMMPLYLIAGVSGTGKSRLSHDWANQASRIAVVDLDDFYLAQSDPRLPHVHGDPDWESAESVDLRAATAAIDSLLCGQDTSVPIYDMSSNSIVGRRVIGASDIEAVVVHGVLAFDIFSHLASRTIRILLKCSTARVLWRRFYRDIDERRRGIWSSAVHSLRMATKDHAYNEANSAVADFIYESGIAPQKLREQVASDLEGFRYSDA